MKWILFACTIITCFISICDAVITVFDTLGSTITLECSHSENEKITWRGPNLGNAVYATWFGINTNLHEELHSRLFVSMDQAKRKTCLRIVNIQISDEGLYQCSAGESRLIESFDLQLPGLLSSNDPTYNRFLLIDPVFNKLIVGQMNAIRLIDIQDKPVFPAQSTTINFNPEGSKLSYCILQKPEVPYCQNHIRFITKKTDDTFILCGTNANSPTGYDFNITDSSQVNIGDVPCSNDPFDNFTAIYTTSYNPNNQALMYYGATKNGESTIHRPIYGNDGNVQDYMKGVISNKWMKDPQFVGSFDINDRVLFFFREVAIEAEPFEHKIYSRVAKVCKEDIGGDSMLRNKWTGYQKARLNCSIPGDFPITFDVLQDVVSTDNTIFYGLFTSGVGTPASAICAFKISEIEKAFNGQFKEPQVDSLYYWTAATSVPTPRPGVCTNDSKSTANDVLTFIVDHPLMHEIVQPMYDKPVFVMNDVELQQLELHGNTSDVIFYAASNTGKVYKLLLKDNTTYLSSTFSPLNNSEIIWSMKQHADYVYIGTDNAVRHIKVINCEQYRWIDSCVKDPHCAWINDTSLLQDSSMEDEIQCYNRCRALSFVEENGITNKTGVFSHKNYDLSRSTAYSCCPSKPTQLQVIAVYKTQLELRWMAGFNGGDEQIFIVEYHAEESTSWKTVEFDYNGTDSDPHSFTLQELKHESLYTIRLYAKNTIGPSTKTSPIVVATKAENTDEEDLSRQKYVYLAAASFIINIVLIIVIGIVVKCMLKTNKQKHKVKDSHDDFRCKENEKMYDKSNKGLFLGRINEGMNYTDSVPPTKILSSQGYKDGVRSTKSVHVDEQNNDERNPKGEVQNTKYVHVDEQNNDERTPKDKKKTESKKKSKKRRHRRDEMVNEGVKGTKNGNIDYHNTDNASSKL